MKYKIIAIPIILSCLHFLSCRSSEKKMPVSREKFLEVMADIHTAETIYENESTYMKDSLSALYYPQIFEKNGITAKDYDSSMGILSDNPVMMKRFYEDVIKKLQSRSVQDTAQLAQ